MTDTTQRVARQYETNPYPHRDPTDERQRLVRTDLDDLAAVNFHCFRGRRRFDGGFRALVAGGGTGDAAVYLAHQLRRTDAAVVYLDLSEASMAIARARAQVRGLDDRITWLQGSLLDLPAMGLAPFDYINCSGVLHHLDDPAAGLAALEAMLAPDGAMGLMLYGQIGRTGVYQMQALMRLLNDPSADLADQMANTRAVLEEAPPTHWYKRGWGQAPMRYDMNDAELVDMFLHAKDQAFTVDGLYDLVEGAGLRLVELTADQRLFYDIRYATQSARLRAAVGRLSERERRAAAELFHGVLGMHTFWVARRADTRADPSDPEMVPFFSHAAREQGLDEVVLRAAGRPWSLRLGPEGSPRLSFTVRPDPVGQRFLESVDGRAALGDIETSLLDEAGPSASVEDVRRSWRRMLDQMLRCDLLLLRHRSVSPLPQEHE